MFVVSSRKLHEPEKIELWNPEAPINTFWDISSQVKMHHWVK